MNYTAEEKICILFGDKGLGASKFYQLWQLYQNAACLVKNFCADTEAEKITGELYPTLCHGLKTDEVEKIIAEMENYGVSAVTCFSESFPESLVNIPDPPYVLFCRGNVEILSDRCLGVVGTRKVSSYGKRVATDFVTVLSKQFTIVSGLAYGVDAIAHETAVKDGGKTIAVLGGGLIKVYPGANQGLAEKIVQSGGLLVSEYGMFAEARAYRFPHRNRLVSGLSLGLLVCQAPLKSGTAGTVDCALEQGRDVFAVPGEIYDFGFQGNNNLIKSMQGVCVISPSDVLEFYHIDNVTQNVQECTYQLNFDEQKVV